MVIEQNKAESIDLWALLSKGNSKYCVNSNIIDENFDSLKSYISTYIALSIQILFYQKYRFSVNDLS